MVGELFFFFFFFFTIVILMVLVIMIIFAAVINISIHKICCDFVNKLFISKMSSAKRTLIFSVFVKAFKLVKIKSKKGKA